MYGFGILCEISKGTLNPYTAKYAYYCFQFLRLSYDILELWRHSLSETDQSDNPEGLP